MPYYKKKAFVEEAINSVLCQTYKKFELLLIYDDENLSDYKYISNLAKKDNRIKLFKNKKNLGSGLSRNLGIKHSKGFYSAFLDSDDVWFKNKLKVKITTKDLRTWNANNLFINFRKIHKYIIVIC
jgi:glycosyltransferase involved in cell wall biosynthesis